MIYGQKKGTLAKFEAEQPKSKTPLVDELCDTTVKYSPKYSHELTLLAKNLEERLGDSEKNLAQCITQIKSLKDRIAFLHAAEGQKHLNDEISKEKREKSDRPTRFDSMTNFEVMERLRKFGFGKVS